jgi:DNA-directed RNA polymerase II subunit RPB3
LAELQTKLANLILGLKTQPELEQLEQDSARPHAPVAGPWAAPPGEGWGTTTSPSRAGDSGGGWGSPSREWGNSSAAPASWATPNANSADAETSGWGVPTSTGWQSPNPKTNSGWSR